MCGVGSYRRFGRVSSFVLARPHFPARLAVVIYPVGSWMECTYAKVSSALHNEIQRPQRPEAR